MKLLYLDLWSLMVCCVVCCWRRQAMAGLTHEMRSFSLTYVFLLIPLSTNDIMHLLPPPRLRRPEISFQTQCCNMGCSC